MNFQKNTIARQLKLPLSLCTLALSCTMLFSSEAALANNQSVKITKKPFEYCQINGLRPEECDDPFDWDDCNLDWCDQDDEAEPDDTDDDSEPDDDGEGNDDETPDDDGEGDGDETPDDDDGDGDGNGTPTGNGTAIGNCPSGNESADNTIYQVSHEKAFAASRFLTQASMGANHATITQVAKLGHEAWVEQQFNLPVSKHQPYTNCMSSVFESYGNEETAGAIFGDPVFFKRFAWWTQTITAPDILRQRVAMALSEIMVVSDKVGILGEAQYGLPGYYDMLLNHSFGNFRDLLFDVTMSPVMGTYLSHVNNAKFNPTTGTFPDENYAREVMQLFSIGLFELNPDGTRKKDANGADIPTYDNNKIREFARVFTGLSYAGPEAHFGQIVDDEYYWFQDPMQMFSEYHDSGSKSLLNAKVLPANQDPMKDINDAVDNLFNHPNVGPFIGTLLIKRLVTSNPSPAYVARVTQAFNGINGGPRGDMKALIKAILFDVEAQNANRIREPFIRLVQLYRTFNATSVDGTFNIFGDQEQEHVQQHALSSPSVFNFFQSNFAPNGEIKDQGLTAPEFQIINSSTILSYKNYLFFVLLEGGVAYNDNYAPIELNLSVETELAQNPGKLVDHLDMLLTYGTLSSNTRTTIIDAITQLDNNKERALFAVYLMMISPDYTAAI